MSKTVCAIYKNHELAAKAISVFESEGYAHDNFSILTSKESFRNSKAETEYITSKEFEGLTIGGDIGGIAGAVLGGLTAAGTITLTGGAGLLAAGPILSVFVGGALGASFGSVVGALVEHGISEAEARMVDEELGKGKVLLEIHVIKKTENKIGTLLKDTHPEKVFSHKSYPIELGSYSI